MDEGAKKQILLGLVVVFLIAAGVITYLTYPKGTGGGINSIPADATTWVKCNNTSCNAEYEMNLREFEKEVQAKLMGPYVQPITCQKCGKDSVLRAYKCEKCSTVFFYGRPGVEYPDQCPKCSYSKMKEKVDRVTKEQGEKAVEESGTETPEE